MSFILAFIPLSNLVSLHQILPHTNVCSAQFEHGDFKKTLTGKRVLKSPTINSLFSRTHLNKPKGISSKEKEYFFNTEQESLRDLYVPLLYGMV